MTDFGDEPSEAGVIQPDPIGDAHGADPQADLFSAGLSEGSDIGVDPEADPHVGKEMLALISMRFFAQSGHIGSFR